MDPADIAQGKRGKRDVSIVEMKESIGADLGRSTRWTVLEELKRKGIQCLTGSRVMDVTEEGISFQRGGSIDFLKVDTVIFATGTKANDELFHYLEGRVPELYRIGDCREPRKAFHAIHEGFELGLSI